MKTLIAYYSKSGTNEAIAKELQKMLGADIERIIDLKDRNGFFGFFSNGFDALKKKSTKIAPLKKNPAAYVVLVLVSPVWAGYISPALRAYVSQNREKIKKFAFLSISLSGTKNKKVLPELEDFAGKKAIASLMLSKKEAESPEGKRKLMEFAKKLK
ncbi:MAG: flavodoxin [Candidatus Diapherotrites archaeon]